jgi:hypothetical protein
LNQLPQGRTKKQTSVWKIFGLGKQKEEWWLFMCWI